MSNIAARQRAGSTAYLYQRRHDRRRLWPARLTGDGEENARHYTPCRALIFFMAADENVAIGSISVSACRNRYCHHINQNRIKSAFEGFFIDPTSLDSSAIKRRERRGRKLLKACASCKSHRMYEQRS